MRSLAPEGYVIHELSEGWQLASTDAEACEDARALAGLEWIPARVPGTAAASLRDAGSWRPGERVDLDARDWWFRCTFDAEPARPEQGEEVVLVLEGIATVAEVYLNGERILESESMFARHVLDVGERLRGENELAICCRALAPRLLAARRPRARWRTRLVSDGSLRFFRTMLLGRAPGFAPGPPAVGPWRPVRLERRRGFVIEALGLRTRLEGDQGVLAVRVQIRALGSTPAPTRVAIEVAGAHRSDLALDAGADGLLATGEVSIPNVERWWPHTHGEPTLHPVRLVVGASSDELSVDLGRVGFRALDCGEEVERDGIELLINGARVFARGAVWTPPDLALPYSSGEQLREALQRVAAAGMNMLRVPGTACYESEEFHDLCDELGILVWQDFMFANLDYPEQDSAFMEAVEQEVRAVLAGLGGRPSLAVICGNSEIAQQVAMLGLDPQLAAGPLFGELLPSLVKDAALDAGFVPSAPCGGDLPFRPDRGVANYFGVGAYLRPLEDARRSEVRFASECLAFSNVPDDEALAALDAPGGAVTHDPAWKAGVPRDAGAGWDFEDVRDHYLEQLFGLDPVALRSSDHERYLDLSRAVTGEVMAEVFGEWRRQQSSCAGALVLWLGDLQPGAGWGVLDHRGEPKVAYHHLRRALAPVAAWSTDEGLGGIVAHVANDRPEPLQARLRVSLYRDLQMPVGEASEELELGPHTMHAANLESMLGRFVDIAWAYRFGRPAQDLVVVSLERGGDQEAEMLSQSFRLTAGRPLERETAAALGLRGSLSLDIDGDGHGAALLTVSSERFAYGVRIRVPGYVPDDDAFSVEPGHTRRVRLRRDAERADGAGALTALNLLGKVPLDVEQAE